MKDTARRETVRREVVAYQTVEVPDGCVICVTCRGRGKASKYDCGWSSLVHSPELAVKRTCPTCGGLGYVNEDGTMAEGADHSAMMNCF